MIKKDLLDKGVQRLGLERLQSFSNEGNRTSLGVQWSRMPSGYASELPMQRSEERRRELSAADFSGSENTELDE